MKREGASTANVIPVRMGEMAVSRDGRDVLSVVGLGSCVAIILIAPQKGAAGLAHVVLPEARMTGGREAPAAKFADTAVPAMLAELRQIGIKPEDLYAMLIGGATMFGHTHSSKLAGVGDRNVESAREHVARAGIGIESEETGGTSGRSVHLAIAELGVYVRRGPEDPSLLPGRSTPLAVKVSADGADLQSEPFPDDIWTAKPAGGSLASDPA